MHMYVIGYESRHIFKTHIQFSFNSIQFHFLKADSFGKGNGVSKVKATAILLCVSSFVWVPVKYRVKASFVMQRCKWERAIVMEWL